MDPATHSAGAAAQTAATPNGQEISWAADLHEILMIFHDSPASVQVMFLLCATIVMIVLLSATNRKAFLKSMPIIGKYIKDDEKEKPAEDDHAKISKEFLGSFQSSYSELSQQTNSLLVSLATGIEHLGADFDRIGDRMERIASMLNQCVVNIADLASEIRSMRRHLERSEHDGT